MIMTIFYSEFGDKDTRDVCQPFLIIETYILYQIFPQFKYFYTSQSKHEIRGNRQRVNVSNGAHTHIFAQRAHIPMHYL